MLYLLQPRAKKTKIQIWREVMKEKRYAQAMNGMVDSS